MNYKEILTDYFELLFYGTFSLSTLFLIFLFGLSYKYKKIVSLLAYMGAAAIPFWFGIASRYFSELRFCTAERCDVDALIAFFVYFFVNGMLALGFWVLRARQEKEARRFSEPDPITSP